MRRKLRFFACAAGLTLALSATGLVRAASSIALPDSIRPVAEPPTVGPPDILKPFIQRHTLTAAELSAPVRFEINLKMRNRAELSARLAQGEQISASEMAAKYDPLPADYARVVAWVTAQGITVERKDAHHHMALFLRGKAGLVAKALQASFARVRTQDGEYTSLVTAPAVPDDLSPLLVGVNGLQPHIHAHKHIIKGANSGGSTDFTPAAIAKVYGATGLYAQGLTGAGQTIAIVIDDFPLRSDLSTFWQNYGISQSLNNITFIKAVTETLPAASGEETLDTEWSSSMAPGAKIRVYGCYDLASNDLDEGFQKVCDDVLEHPEYGIHEVSMSFGEGEVDLSTGQTLADDQFFSVLAAAGVSLFAASGDGASTPDTDGGTSGALQVESPASDPNVTGVGGTSLNATYTGTYTSESAWTYGGGGVSVVFGRPAWQTGATVPAGGFRLVPDVSSAADPDHGAVLTLDGSTSVIGGTSWSCPMWAGLCALLNQARIQAGQSPLGALGPRIYPVLNSSAFASCFRDITTGSNATGSSGGKYSAKTGYDEVTGIGTPLMGGLLAALTPPETLPVGQTVAPGQTGTFTAAATGTVTAYQWQRMPFGATSWGSVTNSGVYTGATTGTLSIGNVTTAMNGDQFQCLITSSGTVVTTAPPSTLVVDEPLLVSTLAGDAGVTGSQNGTGTQAQFNIPSGVAIDGSGNVYVADYFNNQIREITSAGTVTTPYGSLAEVAGSQNGTGNTAKFSEPNGVVFDGTHYLYVAEAGVLDSNMNPIPGNGAIRKIDLNSKQVTTFATGFYSPLAVALDASGNLFVTDSFNQQVDEVSPAGVVTVLAGQNQVEGFADGTGTAALFANPEGIAVDSADNIYVADSTNAVIRKVTTAGVVTTPFGQAERFGYRDGIGTAALFNQPLGLAFDGAGNLYVTDSGFPPTFSAPDATVSGNNLLRKITPSGIVSTVAGKFDISGSTDGLGTAAEFFSLQAAAVGPNGVIFLADAYNDLIRAAAPAEYLSLSATQPAASAFGPVVGEFTVSRTGSTTASLAVTYTVAGTAIAGTDYTALTGTLTIPAGASTAVIDVTPILDPSATASRTVVATLGAAPGLYVLASPTSGTVTIAQPTPYQSWKLSEFGSNAYVASIAGDLADPNGNGVPNLLEYAFHANPLQTGTEPLPAQSIVESGGSAYLAITYTQLTNDSSLTYTVQVSSDLVNWTSGSSATTQVSSVAGTGSTTVVTVRDNTALTGGAQRFIRVLVSEN